MNPVIDLTGFTLSAGNGRCEIGFTGDYTPDDQLVSTIQKKIQEEDQFDVELRADKKKGLLVLIIGVAAQAVDLLLSFILRTIRETGYGVAA
ncbi:hypothetical protein [Candidatus Nanosyncoccus alces]|uniref:Uncharacterized protein n=1 Tax=Candidatus Nanosyncoccus alces TaxID=2171997 RepID=A0ABY0FM85_9BACT|nr:hypothetical protein [Candidatus Nanosyncoccus alces]RYC74989.1 hypothetical protein G3RUM_00269 [Candidatus Nanosyncoccus alces]